MATEQYVNPAGQGIIGYNPNYSNSYILQNLSGSFGMSPQALQQMLGQYMSGSMNLSPYELANNIDANGGMQKLINGPAMGLLGNVGPWLQDIIKGAYANNWGASGTATGSPGSGPGSLSALLGSITGGGGGVPTSGASVFDAKTLAQIAPTLYGAYQNAINPFMTQAQNVANAGLNMYANGPLSGISQALIKNAFAPQEVAQVNMTGNTGSSGTNYINPSQSGTATAGPGGGMNNLASGANNMYGYATQGPVFGNSGWAGNPINQPPLNYYMPKSTPSIPMPNPKPTGEVDDGGWEVL